MKQFPILYHKTSKGAINTWEVWSDGPFVYTKWGKLDGKMQESCVEVKPKNIGRANATTVEEQAELEAKSLWTFKLERKYYQTQEEAENELIFLPMLAKSFEDRKRFLTDEEDYPCDLQPKLNGVRCLAFWDKNDRVKLISRSGKEYKMSHIADELEPELPGNIVLDGELYIHGMPLQDLNALVRWSKNKNPDSDKVEYHVYDLIDKNNLNLSWKERRELLKNFFSKSEEKFKSKFVKIVPVETNPVYTQEEVYEEQSNFLTKGYEGAIVRLRNGKYKFGYRSSDLLKVKSFQDAEFEIVNYTNGIGKFENCIIYTCKTKEGKEFNVVPKGTFEQREEWLREGNTHIGKMLKVQFAEWTTDNIPQFPVGICIREEWDM